MFPESFLVTTVTVLTPVSCYNMISIDYGGKKARDVALTCRYHLSNIMPDSISMIIWDGGSLCLFLFSLGVVMLSSSA